MRVLARRARCRIRAIIPSGTGSVRGTTSPGSRDAGSPGANLPNGIGSIRGTASTHREGEGRKERRRGGRE